MRTLSFILVVSLAAIGCDQTTDTTTDTTTTPPSVNTPSTPSTPTTPGAPDTTTPVPAPGSADTSSARPVEPDNTARNERDASGDTKLPTDQDETPADRLITQEIRKKITGDENMSFNARNVKIVTEQGKVTLRGVVDDASEKQAIEKFAAEVAQGPDNVSSELEIVNR